MEKKSSVSEHLNGSKSARRQSKTFKSLTLATLLFILPFGLYWYVQIDQHREYEQEKIYRTLHELDLHIKNEINALTQIKNVLPKKEQLTVASELKPEQYNRIDSCGYKLLEKTKLSEKLGLSNNEKNQCIVSEEFLFEAQEFINLELNKKDHGLESAQNLFLSQIEDGREYIKETRDLMAELIESYQKEIELLCQEKGGHQKEKFDSSCKGLVKLNTLAGALRKADNMNDIFTPSFVVYQQCFEQHGSRYTRKITQGLHLICNSFMTGYEYIVDDMKGFSSDKEVFELEPERTVKNVVLAFNQMLDAMMQIADIIDYKIDQNLMSQHSVEQNSDRERLVARNTFNKNLLEPYQRLVSKSHVCMYISKNKSDTTDELTLISVSQFKRVFGDSWQECKKIIEGESLLLHRTSWLSNDNQSEDSSESLWLVIGFDTILKRYREKLKYLQDIYLASSDGKIVSSFISANKQSYKQNAEQRIINLSPIFSSLDRLAKQGKSDDGISSTEDNIVRVTAADLKVDVSNKDNTDNNQSIIAWPLQVLLEIEAKGYLAMIKPMATMLFKSQYDEGKHKLTETPLVLVGIKENSSVSLFTARLSPLFHLTVLFIALMLILIMPVFHILMAKIRNSYTLRTVRLYGLSVVLVVITGVIGIASYFTMLQQNTFISQQIVGTANQLIGDWERERDANIDFLKKAEACLFAKYYNLSLTKPKNDPYCYPEFSILKEYKNYHSLSKSDPYTKPDTYIYKVKNALPMMGLLFFTNSDAIKQQPDWMAREFIPLKKDKIDLSGRQYFQSISDFNGWQTTSTDTPYHIERIYNYIDGRKVTQLSIPKNHEAYRNDALFSGIISGEILALSLEQPILPPGMRFAVIEATTGKVMFHSEKERVLVENYYKEVDGSENFIDSVKAGSDTMDLIVYRSEKLLAFSKKIPDTSWSLILTYDSAPAHSMVNEVAVGTSIAVLILLFIVSVTVSLFRKMSELATVHKSLEYKQSSPLLEKFEQYLRRFDRFMLALRVKDFYWLTLTICAIFVFIALFLTHEAFWISLLWSFIYMLALLFVTRKSKVNTPKNVTNTGQWIRLNPAPLCYFLILWMGVPTLFIFARWYDLTAHQLESYDYLELKQNVAKRSDYIDQHRKTLWYGEKTEPKNHWLDQQQEKLGVMINFELVDKQKNLHFKDMLQTALYSEQDSTAVNSNAEVEPLYVINEPQSTPTKYTNLTYCYEHREESHEIEHDLWKSIPLLSKLSRIAYSVDGQRCKEGVESDINISIESGKFSDIWALHFDEKFIDENSLSRVKRLNLSSSMMALFIVAFLVGLFVYCRILIKGIWHPYWLTGEPLVIRDSIVYRMPQHRMFIKPCDAFVRKLIHEAADEISVIDNKLYLTLNESSSQNNSSEYDIFLYPSIDLTTMEFDKRLLLLAELETRASKKNTIIWITVDIPPLYRLLKQRAYPGVECNTDLTPHEILRWSNIFKQFYKDYHTGLSDETASLFRKPLPEKFDYSEAMSKSNDLLDRETSAFKPELLWIKDTILREHDCSLHFDNVQRLTAMYAGAFYRYKWEECTSDERLLLYQVASGRYPCPKNNEVIEHLLRRGYLVAKPFLEISNESFREFILNAELQEIFDEWHDEAEQSGWQQLRIYVGVLVVLILAWLAYTSKDTYQQLAYVIGSLLTVFTALTQGANLLKLGKGSNE